MKTIIQYEKEDLISFAKYILSEERKKYLKDRLCPLYPTVKERCEVVGIREIKDWIDYRSRF